MLAPFPAPSLGLGSLVTLLAVAARQRLVTTVSAMRSEEGRMEPRRVSGRGLIPHHERAAGCCVQCMERALQGATSLAEKCILLSAWGLGKSVGNIHVSGQQAEEAAPASLEPFKAFIACCPQECSCVTGKMGDETLGTVLDHNLSFPPSQGWSLCISGWFNESRISGSILKDDQGLTLEEPTD